MDSENGQSRNRVVRQIIIDLTVLTGIGLVLAVLAPLGSGYMSFAQRIAYWVLLSLAGYLFYKPIGAQIVPLSARLDLPEWSMWCATVAIATVPMAVLVWIVNTGAGPVPVPSMETAFAHYFSVLVIGAIVTLMFNLLPATRAAKESAAQKPEAAERSGTKGADPAEATLPTPQNVVPANPATPSNPLLHQLPAQLGSDVVALEMEDHYVRVHTALGSDLVLMRLRDAMIHVAEIEGRQVHRSWWVARLAVEDVKREGRNVRLVLAGGVEAPVSRTQVSELKDAGWI